MSTPGPPKISFSFGAKKAAPAGSTPSSSSSSSAFASKSKPKIAPSNPPSAFSLAADDEDDAPPQLVADSSSRSWGKTRVDPKKLVHQAIKPSRVVRERQEEALGLDQKAFAYDEVWDSMKDAERAAKQRKEDESSDRKPKYMHQAIASAATRKLDLLRAQEKALERERQLEGDEFADKEKFVTQAYKDQMEEVRRAEEEEKKREESLRKSAKGGISAFYSSFLDKSAEAHQAAVDATLAAEASSLTPAPVNLTIQRPVQGPASGPPLEDGTATRDGDQQAIKDALDKGLNVEVNDSGEVVDERSLLAPGLNILPKRAAPAAHLPVEGSSKGPGTNAFAPSRRVGEASSTREIRARTDALLRAQFEEEQERERQAAQAREEARQVGVKDKRNDESAVSSAKQRFEERKRLKLEQETLAKAKAKEAEGS